MAKLRRNLHRNLQKKIATPGVDFPVPKSESASIPQMQTSALYFYSSFESDFVLNCHFIIFIQYLVPLERLRSISSVECWGHFARIFVHFDPEEDHQRERGVEHFQGI